MANIAGDQAQKAHNIVNMAVKNGLLTRPDSCQLCETKHDDSPIVGHHWQGYEKSLADLRGAKIDETTQIDAKWRLVWEIVNQGAASRDLHQVDLRGADLTGADLTGADLQGVYLKRAVYDTETRWPVGFDPDAHGAIDVSEQDAE